MHCSNFWSAPRTSAVVSSSSPSALRSAEHLSGVSPTTLGVKFGENLPLARVSGMEMAKEVFVGIWEPMMRVSWWGVSYTLSAHPFHPMGSCRF